MASMTVAQINAIETQWRGRAIGTGLPAGHTKRYLDAQANFFTGAASAASVLLGDGAIPARWVVTIIRGDDIRTLAPLAETAPAV